MSYAQAAAPHGSQQEKDAHKVPNAMPEIEHDDSPSIHSLDSFNSNSQPSYADQQLAHERAEQAKQEASAAAEETAQQAKEFGQQADAELQRLEKDAGKKFDEFTSDAKEKYQSWKKEAKKDFEKGKVEAKKAGKKAKQETEKGAEWADKNKENPVVIANTVVLAALLGGLGIGAYRLHARNALTWQVAGAWAGALAVFGLGDYYVSQYFFRNHYPTKSA